MKLKYRHLNRLFLFCILMAIIITYNLAKYIDIYRNFMPQRKMKYILVWTDGYVESPFNLKEGNEIFFTRNCPYINCYVTYDKYLLGENSTLFDVIAFYGPDLHIYKYKVPEKRSLHQKYVFTSIESSDDYHLCSETYNNFFNWTWTYKLDSNIRWGNMVIRDMKNNIIGPNKEMHWMNIKEMEPVSEELKVRLKSKKKIAAWIVPNCKSISEKEMLINRLQHELMELDKLYLIHVFGDCDTFYCPTFEGDCYEIVKDYYFYLALEDSFNDDYVTENLLIGLQNNAVPVVFGGANYTMYMPDGIYLNGMKLHPKQLAQKMHELFVNQTKYEEYFKWKNHYSYHKPEETVETNEYCQFCKILNDEELVKKKTVVEDFVSWWNLAGNCYPWDTHQ